MRRQQILGLRLKILFPNKDIKEEYFSLHYRIDFTIEENKLVVEIDKKDHDKRDIDYERRRQKELERLGYYFTRINPDKPNFDEYEEFGRVQKYIEKSTKKSLIDDLSKRLLELEFESNHSIKSECPEWVVKKILPTIKDMKKNQSKIKPIKTGKEIRTTYCLGRKDYTDNFRPQEVNLRLEKFELRF